MFKHTDAASLYRDTHNKIFQALLNHAVSLNLRGLVQLRWGEVKVPVPITREVSGAPLCVRSRSDVLTSLSGKARL